MPILAEGPRRKSPVGRRVVAFAAGTVLLAVGVALLPLTNSTLSFGARGWVAFRVAPES